MKLNPNYHVQLASEELRPIIEKKGIRSKEFLELCYSSRNYLTLVGDEQKLEADINYYTSQYKF